MSKLAKELTDAYVLGMTLAVRKKSFERKYILPHLQHLISYLPPSSTSAGGEH
uniref:Uncharacterized protein n=1 Tax=Arundo donax TaxID=35708 RepID=A0A0A9GYW2_ARUDO